MLGSRSRLSGHLLEREDKLGGLTRKIALFPEKSRIEDFPAYLEHKADCRLAPVRLNLRFWLKYGNEELLVRIKPDILYAATGFVRCFRLSVDFGQTDSMPKVSTSVPSMASWTTFLTTKPMQKAKSRRYRLWCCRSGRRCNSYLRKAEVDDQMMPSFGKTLISFQVDSPKNRKHPVDMHLSTALERFARIPIASTTVNLPSTFDYGFICMGLVPTSGG